MTSNISKASPTKLVRDALKAAPSHPNYDTVAQDVLDKIDPGDYKHYLLGFIKLRIPHQINDDRNGAIKSLATAKPEFESRPSPAPSTFIDIDAPAAPLVRVKTNTARIDAMRNRALQERVSVGEERKRLSELTHADLQVIIQDRVKRKAQMQASMDMYQSFDDALVASGKSTLGDIPEEFQKLLNPALL